MHKMDNKTLVSEYFAVIGGRSDKGIDEFLANDIVWHLPPGHPYGATFEGLDSVLAMMGRGIGLYREGAIRIEVQCLLAEGDDVAAQFQLTGVLTSGADYCNQYMFRFRCEDERIVEVWEYLDTLYASNKGMF